MELVSRDTQLRHGSEISFARSSEVRESLFYYEDRVRDKNMLLCVLFSWRNQYLKCNKRYLFFIATRAGKSILIDNISLLICKSLSRYLLPFSLKTKEAVFV